MSPERVKALKYVLATYQLEDVDRGLIDAALTHPSYGVENPGVEDYERLEFLGDAVLDLVMASYLYRHYPDEDEGTLTLKRSGLVQEAALAKAALDFGVHKVLRLGKGEEASGGAQRPSNLANALEALMGAVYLSLGYQKAETFILRVSKDNLKAMKAGLYGDYKTRLQELVQKDPAASLIYRIPEEKGPAHNRSFKAEVLINGKCLGSAWGKSKRDAQRQAALEALVALGEIEGLQVTE